MYTVHSSRYGKRTKVLSGVEHHEYAMFGRLGRKIRLLLFSNKKISIFTTSYHSLDTTQMADKILDDVHQSLATSGS